MPWSLHNRDGKWCVVKDGESEPVPGGCHDSRAQALKHQRALYANEPAVTAALELDTSSLLEEFFPDPEPAPPVQIVVGSDQAANEALVAALTAVTDRLLALEERQDRIGEALTLLAAGQQDDRENLRTLVAAVTPTEPPVVNVTVPEQPAPVVHVAATPEVTVHLPSKRQIKLDRDPFSGSIISATVEEE